MSIEGGKIAYLYQARRVNTQDNIGGGALTTRVSTNVGQIGRLVHMRAVGALSSSVLSIDILDEDVAGVNSLAYVAAGATRTCYLPSIGAAATTQANIANSVGAMLGPGEFLSSSTSVAAQTETLIVAVVMLLSTPVVPIWDTTGSAGTPNLAASTISAAMQLVVLL